MRYLYCCTSKASTFVLVKPRRQGQRRWRKGACTQFACFASTKVQKTDTEGAAGNAEGAERGRSKAAQGAKGKGDTRAGV